jgi:cysteine desulfuration protein SufE
MSLDAKLQDLLSTYEPISDPQERLSLYVDSARSHARLPAAERTDTARVPGCVSAAWINASLKDGLCEFQCAADSPLVQGLIAGLCAFFSGATPAEVASSPADPLGALGLTRNLSPTRQNGLAHARKRIQALAEGLR